MNFKQFLNETKVGYDADGYITLKYLEDKIAEGNATINFNYDDVSIKSLDDAIKKFGRYVKKASYIHDNDGKITVDHVRTAQIYPDGTVYATKANGARLIKRRQ